MLGIVLLQRRRIQDCCETAQTAFGPRSGLLARENFRFARHPPYDSADRSEAHAGRQHHLFNFAVQLSTTDIGALSACFTCVLIRNRCPSRLTS